jgi:L-rhamnose mutarotase
MRVCFQLQVKPDRLDEYRERHAAVWPEMLEALAATGWHNYSLFLGPDGLLIGYFETPSLDDALAGMAATDVNRRWQAEMADYFEALDGRTPDEGFLVLDEVFHLEDQLEYQLEDQLEDQDEPGRADLGTTHRKDTP